MKTISVSSLKKELGEENFKRLKKKYFKSLKSHLERGDLAGVFKILAELACQQGISYWSQTSGTDRSHLYEIFKGNTFPRIDNFITLLNAMGFGITLRMISPQQKKPTPKKKSKKKRV
jgi:DNA-binding phage protein